MLTFMASTISWLWSRHRSVISSSSGCAVRISSWMNARLMLSLSRAKGLSQGRPALTARATQQTARLAPSADNDCMALPFAAAQYRVAARKRL